MGRRTSALLPPATSSLLTPKREIHTHLLGHNILSASSQTIPQVVENIEFIDRLLPYHKIGILKIGFFQSRKELYLAERCKGEFRR
jgi:hypothetical protein